MDSNSLPPRPLKTINQFVSKRLTTYNHHNIWLIKMAITMRLLPLLLVILLLPAISHANTLTISHNDNIKAQLTTTDLQAMPATAYTTSLPWISNQSTFTGVKLSTLLQTITGTTPDTVTLRALNDYSVTINKQDIEHYEPIVAYYQDGKPMRIRNKGPYWLIYSLTDFPMLDNPHYHAQMIWQLDRIQIK